MNTHNHTGSGHEHCAHTVTRRDYLLIVCSTIIIIAYISSHWSPYLPLYPWIKLFNNTVFDLVNTMSWGIILGVIFIGILGRVPREIIMGILGTGKGIQGIFRAVFAGVLLDLCSHGILMVGTKIYERGASLGQVMAFLIASPWNSFSLTLILWSLVGFKWMAVFLVLSMVIAIISGVIFDYLVGAKVLNENPNSMDIPEDFNLINRVKVSLSNFRFNPAVIGQILISGLKDSRMVMRWIFFGIILAALVRTFVNTDLLTHYFGPTLAGLGLTLLVATILEVCSEGTLPVATDLLTRANAPGNSFAFLMAGVSTDYTEIMVVREATQSWKIPLFLPLITLPQVLLISYLLNLA